MKPILSLSSSSSPTIFSQILIVLYLSSAGLAAPTVNTNHRIIFKGLRHGFSDDREARESLTDRLRSITGYRNVTVDSFDSQGASWYVDGISDSTECPREEIEKILDTIRDKTSDDYTRNYKVFMTEEFGRPTSVKIDWFGPCAQRYQKRSHVLGEKRASDDNVDNNNVTVTMGSDSTEEEMATTTTTIAGDMGSTEVNTTEPNAVETTTTQVPPTTTQVPLKEPTFSMDAEFPAINTSSFFAPDFPFGDSNITSGLQVAQMPFPTTTTTTIDTTPTPTPTTTTTTTATTTATDTATTTTSTATDAKTDAGSSPTTSATDTATTDSTTTPTDTATDTSDITTTMVPPAATVDETVVAAADSDAKLLSSPPSTSPRPSDLLGASEELASGNPHIGKYIGLGGGFLIVLAYLVCSRAFKRQGMYELHANE